MELGSRLVERMLAANFGIEEDRLLAFRGRLDHLRRRGCPSGVNTGKGKAAIYGWPQIIDLALALSLLDLGVSPEHASAFLDTNARSIHLAVQDLVCDRVGSDKLMAIAEQREWPIKTTTFLVGTSFALAGLTPRGGSNPSPAAFLRLEDIGESFDGVHDVGRSVFLIDLGTKVASLIGLVAIWAQYSVEDVVADIRAWGEKIADELLEAIDGLDT